MTKSRSFIYSHQAKLQWKIIKHGAGVLAGREEQTRHATSANHHSDIDDLSYIETPVNR